MSNFYFLEQEKEYSLFSSAAIEAERVYSSAPAMCAIPHSRAFLPFRGGPANLEKTALYRQARQHGSPYRKAYFRR